MPEPFNFVAAEWIEPTTTKGEQTFESWEQLQEYMQVEDQIDYLYRTNNMPPDPAVLYEAYESELLLQGGESPFRSDVGVAWEKLRSSNVHFS